MSSLQGSAENVDSKANTVVLGDRILPALIAVVFGLVLLYAAGFAETAELHNAAHDSRHSAAFPCH